MLLGSSIYIFIYYIYVLYMYIYTSYFPGIFQYIYIVLQLLHVAQLRRDVTSASSSALAIDLAHREDPSTPPYPVGHLVCLPMGQTSQTISLVGCLVNPLSTSRVWAVATAFPLTESELELPVLELPPYRVYPAYGTTT